MRILLHTRTAGDLDWEKRVIELDRLPAADEYVAARSGPGTDATWHWVRLVIHVADAAEFNAEVYCERVGKTQLRNRAYMATMGQEGQGESRPTLLTPDEAARIASVSKSTICRLCETGRLKASNYATGKQRAKWRIAPEDLKTVTPPASVTTSPTPAPAEAMPRVDSRRRRRLLSSAVSQYLPDAGPA